MTTENDIDNTTAAQVIREEAHASHQVQTVDVAEGVQHIIGSDRLQILATIDSEAYAPKPRRSRATIQVHSAEAFIQATNQRKLTSQAPTLYADEEHRALVAILNDDHEDEPGWRDNRVELALRETEPWKWWTNRQGLRTQSHFAETVDRGLPDIEVPDGATMLEIAQTFEATVGVKFKQQGRLRDGNRQLQYEEDTQQSGGVLALPEQIVLNLQPYFGSRKYAVDADLRFQVPRGAQEFQIGYFLVRPEDVEQAAFADVQKAVEEGLALTAVAGVAPPAVAR